MMDLRQTLVNTWSTNGGYVVKISVGSTNSEQSLIFDTGSSLTWVQCQCSGCSKKQALFAPSKSRSYQNVKCNDKTCSRLDPGNRDTSKGCSKSRPATCPYKVAYLSGSGFGQLSSDIVSLSPAAGKKSLKLRLVFGCQQSTGIQTFSANGILGAGRTGLSFPSQLQKNVGRDVFSTCLVGPFSKTSSSIFYGGAAVPKTGMAYTQLLTNSADQSPIFYYVRVVAVLVGGKKVKTSASAFKIVPKVPYTGTFLDTGTSFALLAANAWDPIFKQVSQAVQNAISVDPVNDGYGGFYEPCYSYSSRSLFPSIQVVFKGGPSIITLQPNQYMYSVGGSTVCNFIQKTNLGVNILGAMFLMDNLVVWDRQQGRIGFKGVDCATGKAL